MTKSKVIICESRDLDKEISEAVKDEDVIQISQIVLRPNGNTRIVTTIIMKEY